MAGGVERRGGVAEGAVVSDVVLELQSPPGTLGSFARALTGARKRAPAGVSIPRLQVNLSPQVAEAQRLAEYRRLCGLRDDGRLPPTWPQVLAAPLHVALLTHRSFPLPALGVVHVSQRIEQLRPLPADAALALTAIVEGHREVEQGVELDLVTEARLKDELVWRGVSVLLSRRRSHQARPPRRASEQLPGEAPGSLRSVVWRAGEDAGRRYAAVSGDWNPIHLHPLTARAFGFPRAIAHGMWTFARSLGEAMQELPGDASEGVLRVEVAFRRPVLLPSAVHFSCRRAEEGVPVGGIAFELRSKDAAKVHLSGTVEVGATPEVIRPSP